MYVQIIQESDEWSRDDVSLCEFLPEGTRQSISPGRRGRKEPYPVCTGEFNKNAKGIVPRSVHVGAPLISIFNMKLELSSPTHPLSNYPLQFQCH